MIDEQLTLEGRILFLPAEISTEIFKQTIWVDINSHLEDAGNGLQVTPLTLGAVCRSWRALVWDAPLLWTVIILKLTDNHCKVQADILDRWLQNSETYPLEIYFDASIAGGSSMEYDLMGIVTLKKLVCQCLRWKKFQTRITDNLDPEFIDVLRRINGKIPLLQSCWLTIEQSFPVTMWDMFEEAPLLKGFTISGLYDIDKLKLPWEQLASFYGIRVIAQGCFEILSRCTNLIECAFSCVVSDLSSLSGETQNRIHMSLPHLRSLSITETKGPDIKKTLLLIQCPALRELRLSTDHPDDKLSILEIKDFIHRSECALEVLNLENFAPAFDLTSQVRPQFGS